MVKAIYDLNSKSIPQIGKSANFMAKSGFTRKSIKKCDKVVIFLNITSYYKMLFYVQLCTHKTFGAQLFFD